MLNILRQRRSIRQYTPTTLTLETMTQLQEAVLRSPSSRGQDPWEFIFVTDKDLLGDLATAKPRHAHFLRDAALGVVILGDDSLADTWIEDCSIATIILQLACTSLDLGSCWIQIRGREYQPGVSAEERVRELLHIPDNFRVLAIVSIGHPAETAQAHQRQSLKENKIKMNFFK